MCVCAYMDLCNLCFRIDSTLNYLLVTYILVKNHLLHSMKIILIHRIFPTKEYLHSFSTSQNTIWHINIVAYVLGAKLTLKS